MWKNILLSVWKPRTLFDVDHKLTYHKTTSKIAVTGLASSRTLSDILNGKSSKFRKWTKSKKKIDRFLLVILPHSIEILSGYHLNFFIKADGRVWDMNMSLAFSLYNNYFSNQFYFVFIYMLVQVKYDDTSSYNYSWTSNYFALCYLAATNRNLIHKTRLS